MTHATLNAILQLCCTRRACAVDTTEDLSVRFDAVADDTAVAVGANGRKRVNCALEAIENVTFPIHDDFKGLVTAVQQFVRARRGEWQCRILATQRNLASARVMLVLSLTPRFSEVPLLSMQQPL